MELESPVPPWLTILRRSFLLLLGIAGGMAIICFVLWLGLEAVVWYGSFDGTVVRRPPVFAAATKQSLLDFEAARERSGDLTSLSLFTSGQIMSLAPGTAVRLVAGLTGWSRKGPIRVRIQEGPAEGRIVWVRAKDIFWGSYL